MSKNQLQAMKAKPSRTSPDGSGKSSSLWATKEVVVASSTVTMNQPLQRRGRSGGREKAPLVLASESMLLIRSVQETTGAEECVVTTKIVVERSGMNGLIPDGACLYVLSVGCLYLYFFFFLASPFALGVVVI